MSKHELTVENMFAEKLNTIDHLVSGATLSASDRRHMLTHVVTDVVGKLLAQNSTNPIGLSVTVTLAEIPGLAGTNLLVRASAPQYELSDDFFD